MTRVRADANSAAPSLWRHRDFLALWGAQSVSQLGAHVTLLAMPLAAVLLLQASPVETGLLTASEHLPFLLIGLPAGVWVDRWPRRTVMLVADFGRAAILLVVPAAHMLGVLQMWVLYLVAFLTGLLTVFFDVAYQSYLPSLVRPDQLVDGNTKLELSRSSSDLAGPSMAGFVVQWLGAATALLVNAMSYLASALALLAIRRREEPLAATEAGTGSDEALEGSVGGRPGTSLRKEIKTGLRFVFGSRLLRPITVCTALVNLVGLGGAVQALLVLYATKELHMSPGTLGLTMAVGNVGALLGVMVTGRLLSAFGPGRVMIVSIALTSASMLLLPTARPSTAIVTIGTTMAIAGAGSTIYNVTQISLRQTITPMRMQGRMNATMRFAVWGTIPLGAVIGGTLGSLLGVRQTLWLVAIAGLFACVPLLRSQVRVLRRMPEARTQDVDTV